MASLVVIVRMSPVVFTVIRTRRTLSRTHLIPSSRGQCQYLFLHHFSGYSVRRSLERQDSTLQVSRRIACRIGVQRRGQSRQRAGDWFGTPASVADPAHHLGKFSAVVQPAGARAESLSHALWILSNESKRGRPEGWPLLRRVWGMRPRIDKRSRLGGVGRRRIVF